MLFVGLACLVEELAVDGYDMDQYPRLSNDTWLGSSGN